MGALKNNANNNAISLVSERRFDCVVSRKDYKGGALDKTSYYRSVELRAHVDFAIIVR